jgi:hypothetical protein
MRGSKSVKFHRHKPENSQMRRLYCPRGAAPPPCSLHSPRQTSALAPRAVTQEIDHEDALTLVTGRALWLRLVGKASDCTLAFIGSTYRIQDQNASELPHLLWR